MFVTNTYLGKEQRRITPELIITPELRIKPELRITHELSKLEKNANI